MGRVAGLNQPDVLMSDLMGSQGQTKHRALLGWWGQQEPLSQDCSDSGSSNSVIHHRTSGMSRTIIQFLPCSLLWQLNSVPSEPTRDALDCPVYFN